jgi:hypothetical protein
MKRLLLLLLALSIATSTRAQPLPPPQNPADAKKETPPQGPALLPPQNAPLQDPAAAKPAQKNPGKPREFFAARRQAQINRKQAAKDRMQQYKAAQAAAREKLYQDWHERYIADTPARVEYYRAMADAYRADAAAAEARAAYLYAWGPPVFIPIIPFYAPAYYYYPPTYGTTFFWGW